MPQSEPFHEQLARAGDRVVNLILYSDMEWIDVAIEENRLREWVRDEAPDRLEAFERIYASRFRRIWEQWRA